MIENGLIYYSVWFADSVQTLDLYLLNCFCLVY